MLGSFCSFVVVKSVCDVTRHTYLPPGCCFLPLCASRTILYTRPHLAASKLVVYVIKCSRAAAGGCGAAAAGAVGHSPSSTLNTHTRINPLVLHHSSPTTTPPPSSIQSVSSVPSLQGAARKTTKIFDTPFWRVFFLSYFATHNLRSSTHSAQ